MAKDDLYFRLRLPEDIKRGIEKAAADNRRSMTAEIVHRLQTTLESDTRGGVVEAVGVASGSSDAKAEGAAIASAPGRATSRLTDEEKEDLWQWMLKRRDKGEPHK